MRRGADAVHTTAVKGGGWTNGDGKIYRYETVAIAVGRELARQRGAAHVVHDDDGRVRAYSAFRRTTRRRVAR
jgi:hypothetical protein